MRLAAHLGMTREELLDRMDSAEYELWHYRFFDSPFGDESRLLAAIAANILNAAPFRAKDAPVFEPADFLPKRPVTEAARQTIEAQKEMAKALAMALGGPRKR